MTNGDKLIAERKHQIREYFIKNPGAIVRSAWLAHQLDIDELDQAFIEAIWKLVSEGFLEWSTTDHNFRKVKK